MYQIQSGVPIKILYINDNENKFDNSNSHCLFLNIHTKIKSRELGQLLKVTQNFQLFFIVLCWLCIFTENMYNVCAVAISLILYNILIPVFIVNLKTVEPLMVGIHYSKYEKLNFPNG